VNIFLVLEVGSKAGAGPWLTQHRPPNHQPLAPHDWDPQQIRVPQGRPTQGGFKSHFVAVGMSNRIW